MTWSFNTGCKYHTQDTSYYCGAAGAMMVLAEIGVPYADLDQDDLYASNHSHNVQPGWATDPIGLRFTLVDRRPAGFTNTFVVHKPTTEAEGTRKIVHTLRTYGVSPVALVYHCMHWIVVCGVQTDVDPSTGPYTVEGFWINNPVWYEGPNPPPHDAADACGTGGVHGLGNQFVTYAAWQSTYFTGCNYDDPGGASQYISVCDPEVPKIQLPGRRQESYFHNGRTLLGLDKASDLAMKGLEEYRLPDNKHVAEKLKKAKPGQPQLVTRLDRPNEFYYLVPMQTEEGITALAQVDGRFGIFNSLQLLEKPVKEWFMPKEKVSRRINGHKFELAEEKGRFVIYPGTYCISPTLVWMPCRQSYSSHLPFYLITVGGQKIYVRMDGAVFTSLNTSGRCV